MFPQAPLGFTYPGDDGFPNGKAGMNKVWSNIAPRVGVAWDPNGDGRMSVRAGYGMNGEFVNGQFFINAANAPPWGSEVRLTRPLDRPARRPVPRHRRGQSVPDHLRPERAVLAERAVRLVPVRSRDDARAQLERQRCSGRSATNMALSASYIGNYTTNLWDVVTGNPGTIPGGGAPTGPCTLRLRPATQTFPNCSAAPLDLRRELTQLDPATGRFIGFLDYFTDTGTQKYNGLLLQMQRRAANGINVSANYTLSKCMGHPSGGGGTANVASGYMMPVSILNPPADAEARLDRDYGPCDTGPPSHLRLRAAPSSRRSSTVVALGCSHRTGVCRGSFRACPAAAAVTTGTDRALTGNQGQQRANQVLDDVYGDKPWIAT